MLHGNGGLGCRRFDALKAKVAAAWNKSLGVVTMLGDDPTEIGRFYTGFFTP